MVVYEREGVREAVRVMLRPLLAQRDQLSYVHHVCLRLVGALRRLPELFCGFRREKGRGPTLYPVACSPQAWAAGSVFMLLQACLGLEIRAKESRVYLYHSALPEDLQQVRIRNLKVGNGSVDIACERYADTVSVNILRRSGNVEIVSIH